MQVVIETNGILDRISARALLARIHERQDALLVRIDCRNLKPVLAEGIDVLLAGCHEILANRAQRLEFFNLPGSFATELMLRKYQIRNRALALGIDLQSGEPDTVVCQNCEAVLKIKGPGYYGCPECGIHLYSDGSSRATFYEPLMRL